MFCLKGSLNALVFYALLSSDQMTKAYEFNWQRVVPEPLQKGCYFDIWDENVRAKSITFKNEKFQRDFFLFIGER